MDFLFSVLAFIVLVGVLVAIHEYGHYLLARLCNVKVLRYSIGFGKVLWSKKTGLDQTEYCLSAIPLGGYVQLLDERSEEVDENEKHRAFNNQSATKKILILFAGPFANFLFAVIAYMTMFSLGVPGVVPIIGEIEPESIAWQNNLKSGDQIINVGEKEVQTWQASLISMIGEILDDEQINITLKDKFGNVKYATLDVTGRTKELTAPNALMPALGFKPFVPSIKPIIESVITDGPADRAGLLPEDVIQKVDDVDINNWSQFAEIIVAKPNQNIQLEIKRQNRTYLKTVLLDSSADNNNQGFIGLKARIDQDQLKQYQAIQKYRFPKSLTMAVNETNQMIVLTLNMLGKMISGQISGKNLSGPVGIAKDAGTVAKRGFIATLSFMAIISISLGVLNLFPIPIVDGGQIVFVLVEKLIGRPLPEKVQIVFQQFGIGALLFLMLFALYNDLIRIFGW
ncbi:MAG: zinc metalloprotease [Woeseia sp.]|nr:MAG: zinc metalloprotease [Woeseia sp.]